MTTSSRKVYLTHHLKANEQFAFWRESICDAFAALDPVADEPAAGPFPSRVELDALPDASIALVQSMPQRVVRAAPQIRRDPQDRLFLNVMLAGTSHVEQGGVGSRVRAGEAYVVDTSRPYVLDHPEPFRLLCVTLPRAALIAPGGPMPAFASARSMQRGPARLAMGLLRQLRRDADALDVQDRAAALAVACGWLAPALAAVPSSPGPQAGCTRGLVDVWRRAVAVIEDRLCEPGLSPPEVAAALHVSLRYLHKAFAYQGATVAGTVRALRLQRCAEALARDGGRRKVAAIAADWGFADVPNFHRQFRQHFGHTPGEHREQRADA